MKIPGMACCGVWDRRSDLKMSDETPVPKESRNPSYEAEQDQPRRTVALKVIKPGLANPELLRRLEQESQALGRLQHPGIAQIYEAGTADAGSARNIRIPQVSWPRLACSASNNRNMPKPNGLLTTP